VRSVKRKKKKRDILLLINDIDANRFLSNELETVL